MLLRSWHFSGDLHLRTVRTQEPPWPLPSLSLNNAMLSIGDVLLDDLASKIPDSFAVGGL